MSEKKKRIGIMGGTFDPIHIGHLILGETAYHQFHLDKVLFMPAGNPPHKQVRENRATDSQRVDMVRLAIASNPHFTLSLEEMHREGYTYTRAAASAADAAARGCARVGVVSHGGALMSLLTKYGRPERAYYGWMCPNCGGFRAALNPDTLELTILEEYKGEKGL